MKRTFSTRWTPVLIGAAVVLAPGAPSQILGGGVPLSPVALVALALVLYAALALPVLTWVVARWLSVGLVLALGLKVLAAFSAPPLGLQASYWANASFSGVPERFTDFLALPSATRIDTALDLRGEEFPVHFFNDASRFNFGPDVVPGRDQLPFNVRWQGWLLAPGDGARRFTVESNGPAQVWLDDTALSGGDAVVDVASGLHALRVEYARLEATVPSLRVSWQRLPGGPLETLRAPDLRWQPARGSADPSVALGMAADLGFAGLLLVWLGFAFAKPALGARARARGPTPPAATPRVEAGRHVERHAERHGAKTTDSRRHDVERHAGVMQLLRAGLAAIPLLFLGYGMLLEAPMAGRSTILSGLDDWLVYESSARDILLHGPLMDGGQGHAPPFYGQPLYPYVLAAAHWLTGEGLFGPIVLQFAALGAVLVGTAALARRAFGERLDGLVALSSLAVLLQLEPEHFKIARQLFNENLYMPLVMASLIVLVSLARRSQPPAWWQALMAGVLLGVTAISRSQFMLCVPLALLILWLAWRRTSARALAATALIAIGLVLTILPVTARNWVVSAQLVPITSNAGASLLEFHRPPPGLIDPTKLQADPLYNALHLDQSTRTVVAFIRADPRGYLATLAPLAAHSIGLQGRNDPGIYWPLLITVLLYAASFGLRRTRQLHVWPTHTFVATHLLVLMLFEADTYGYRLVMPMYAPMVAVAAQLPLAAIRAAVRAVRRAPSVLPATRAQRFAWVGWGALLVGAFAWQTKGLTDVWPDREPMLHGLGGAAAHAAMTSDQAEASAIYVASVDGTPRRFGAGVLPGLRYPWFKWFDPVRSLPLPPPTTTAVYMLSELAGQDLPGDLTVCLGPPDARGEVVIDGERVQKQCTAGVLAEAPLGATFDGLARVEAVGASQTAAAGDVLEARLVWQPLVSHPDPYQVSLQLDDPTADDGMLWGNGTLELYPAAEWRPDETLLSRIPIATDVTAIPQPYRLTLGMSPTRPNAAPALATWSGSRTERVPVARVSLTPGSGPVGQALPADMRPVDGPPLVGNGLELIGARPLPSEAAIGSALRIGLLWRVMQDQPLSTAQFKLRLVLASGEVVQQTELQALGGRVAAPALRKGNVMRDEQQLVVSPRAPLEPLTVELVVMASDAVSDAAVRLGSFTPTGRKHVFDTSGAQPEADFANAVQLLSHKIDPLQATSSEQVSVTLQWRSAASLSTAYKVFVHVLDPAGQQVVTQRDAEPQDGKAPTTSWVVDEVIDDHYTLVLPAGLAPGEYPIEVGVYDPRSGDRLRLANGENRWLLKERLQVTSR